MNNRARVLDFIRLFRNTLTFVIVLISLQFIAQIHTISGNIINNISNSSIVGITVEVIGVSHMCKSDDDGEYSFDILDSLRVIAFKDFEGMNIIEVQKFNENVFNVYLTETNIFDIPIEQLMKMKVTTASNMLERFADVPAVMRLITKQDIEDRGYISLSEIFADLPRFDYDNSYRDLYTKNYLPDYRNFRGDAYLMMYDGFVYNHLYYNEAYCLPTIPISNIEHIEVVYGPVSSVYGANAAMGVIIVITNYKSKKEGVSFNAISTHRANSFNPDFNFMVKKDNFGVSLTAKYEQWNLYDRIDVNSYVYTKTSYLNGKKFWDYTRQKTKGATTDVVALLHQKPIYEKTSLIQFYSANVMTQN